MNNKIAYCRPNSSIFEKEMSRKIKYFPPKIVSFQNDELIFNRPDLTVWEVPDSKSPYLRGKASRRIKKKYEDRLGGSCYWGYLPGKDPIENELPWLPQMNIPFFCTYKSTSIQPRTDRPNVYYQVLVRCSRRAAYLEARGAEPAPPS